MAVQSQISDGQDWPACKKPVPPKSRIEREGVGCGFVLAFVLSGVAWLILAKIGGVL